MIDLIQNMVNQNSDVRPPHAHHVARPANLAQHRVAKRAEGAVLMRTDLFMGSYDCRYQGEPQEWQDLSLSRCRGVRVASSLFFAPWHMYSSTPSVIAPR